MILVDVYVPAVDRVFDFMLDDNASAGELAKEIMQRISELIKIPKEVEKQLCLYAFYRECILDEKLPLKEQGITTGEKLILL